MPNINVVAMLVQEGGKLLSEFLRIRQFSSHSKTALLEIDKAYKIPSPTQTIETSVSSSVSSETSPSKATAVETGCVPCSLGHIGTCSGVLNEAMRFARKDGMNVEVVDRINICLDELNAMERVDLRPQMIENLPGWEKELATETLNESRAIRHKLESVKTVEDLEHLAAKTQEIRNKVGRKWFGAKMDAMPNMTPEIKAKVESKLDELEGARTEAGT